MPLAGSLDIRPLLDDAPQTTLDEREVRIEGVDILQLLYEITTPDIEALVPPALNPTIPPALAFLAYRAEDSLWGPFSLVQVRLAARAGVRPRTFLVQAACDNQAAADRLSGSWGFRIRPAEIKLRQYHDRIECRVSADRRTVLDMAMVDPEPITGHDIQYPPSMHLAHLHRDGAVMPRLIQVDTEYEFHRADRGLPELRGFDASWWTSAPLRVTEPISASFAACDVNIPTVHYLCNPDLPASEGTLKVAPA